MQKLSRWILRVKGWKMVLTELQPPKGVVCVAPHTSNWDFVIGKLAYWAAGRNASFLMKKSWFFFPLGGLFRAMGGVPIDRSKSKSVTQQMADIFNQKKEFHLAITPEGTRSLNDQWKMGFYYIALKAGIPIELAYIDYGRKEVGIKEVFQPTGNEKDDLKHIQEYYRNIRAKFPEKFYNKF